MSIALPDLVVKDLAVSGTLVPGGPITVSFAITNEGAGEAEASDFAIYLSDNSAITSFDTLLSDGHIGAVIEAGQSRSFTVTDVVIPEGTAFGDWFLGVRADDAGEVSEADELNNTANLAVEVIDPDTRYQYVLGEGDSVIDDTDGGSDTVAFDDFDGTVADAARSGDDLLITMVDGGSLRVTGHFAGQAVEQVEDARTGGVFALATGLAGGAGADVLAGTAAGETITGEGGDDRLFAGSGDDLLSGGAGDDVLHAGPGIDTGKGATGADRYVFHAGDGILRLDEHGGDSSSDIVDTLVLADVTSLDDVTFSFVNNYLKIGLPGGEAVWGVLHFAEDSRRFEALELGDGTTFSLPHGLSGDAGDGIVLGTEAAETLTGGAGNDRLTGFAGDDVLIGGTGDDTLEGESGVDTVSYAAATASVDVDLATGTGGGASEGSDTLSQIETVIGSGFGDDIRGDDRANRLVGGGGDDVLVGGGGDDTLEGGPGIDTAKGATGADRYLFHAGDGILRLDERGGDASPDIVDTLVLADVVSIDDVGFSFVNSYLKIDLPDGEAVWSVLHFAHESRRFEALELGDGTTFSLPHDLIGGDADGIVLGTEADETLDGGAGGDRLVGFAGDDVLIGGGGDDTLEGGSGLDTVSYAAASVSVDVDLAAGVGGGGSEGNDTLAEIEAVVGSAFADELRGDGLFNDLSGGGGDDLLVGGAGDDTLDGGGGIDTAKGETGADRYVFNAGHGILRLDERGGDASDSVVDTLVLADVFSLDLVDFSFVNNYLKVGLPDGEAVWSVLHFAHESRRFEALELGDGSTFSLPHTLTGSSADGIILGTEAAETLDGGGGGDRLVGFAGDDLILGGAGDDTLEGGAGIDTAKGQTGADRYVFHAGDGILRLDEHGGDDTANVVDTLVLADVDGLDQVSFDFVNNYLKVGLPDGEAVWGVLHFADESRRFEALELGDGSTFSLPHGDTGTGADEILVGTDDADTLAGGGGSDMLVGDGGDDVLAVADADFAGVDGGAGSDLLRLDGSGLVLDFSGLGAARAAAIETIDIAGTGANRLVIDAAGVAGVTESADRLVVGGDGDDSVEAGTGWTQAGSETIDGESYTVYTQDGTTLVVADAVDRTGIG